MHFWRLLARPAAAAQPPATLTACHDPPHGRRLAPTSPW